MINFSDPILGDNGTLIRQQMQSENFQTGIAGWQITRAGDAEFNSVLVRGELVTDVSPNQRIEIKDAPANVIEFYSGREEETAPARIKSEGPAGNRIYLELVGPDIAGASAPFINLEVHTNTSESFLDLEADDIDITAGGIVEIVGADQVLIGDGSTFGLAMDASTDGLGVRTDAERMQPSTMDDNINDSSVTTNSTSYVTLTSSLSDDGSFTVLSTYSRRALLILNVVQENNTAGQSCLTSFEIRETNSSGTIHQNAGDSESVIMEAGAAGQQMTTHRVFLLEALPQSGNIYIVMKHRVTGGTGIFRRRRIDFVPLL